MEGLAGLGIGLGMFIITLGLMSVVIGETKTAIGSDYCTSATNATGGTGGGLTNCTGGMTVNDTLDYGVTTMYTGSKFGSTIMIVGILAAIVAMFSLVRA